MSLMLGKRIRAALAPPKYLTLPFSGIDLSTSGVKAVHLVEDVQGLTLASYVEVRLPPGACTDGDIVDHATVVDTITTAARETGISAANVSLSESKSYLFETTVQGANMTEWRTMVEQHLDELVPLPPPETSFDIIKVGQGGNDGTPVAGIGFARRIVDETLSVYDQANIRVQALEGEIFAASRALLPFGDTSTALIIDVGKTTTKIAIVTGGVPRSTTTIGIGGHALTLAVQKHFGVTEAEARKVKSERGIVPAPGNEDYLAAMLSTVSAIRDEIARRLDFWQGKAVGGVHEPVSHAILAGGNASIRGLPEYLEGTLRIPVVAGDIFTNLASRDKWIPSLDYAESLAYATAVGLALRDRVQPYV